MPLPTDVAVVGAGILGCLIARHIIERAPGTSVVVLDRETAGGGASRQSAGLHCPRGATDRVRRMTEYSQDYYAKLKDSDRGLPIHPVPISVVASSDSAPRVREMYLPGANLTRVAPPTAPPGLGRLGDVWTWNCEGGQYADVYALVHALARQLRPLVTFREAVRVDAVDTASRDGVRLSLSTGETLMVGQVILAPGPWIAAPAWRDLLAPLDARVKKIVALHIDQRPTAADRTVVFHDEDAFLLPLRDRGHWLFSYTCAEWDVDPDTVATGLSPRNAGEATEALRRYAPHLAERPVSGSVFCDAYSSTGEPRTRALDDDGRVIFAGAANGSGYRLAPAIASDAVDLLRLSDRRPRPARNPRSQP